jgi:hypothetical protein
LLVYPAIYAVWRGWQLGRQEQSTMLPLNSDAAVDPHTGETVLQIP